MVRRFVLAVVIALVSVAALAGVPPCPVLFLFIPGNPDQLHFEGERGYFTPPVVSITGNDITVTQFPFYSPEGPVPNCNSYTVPLGVLPPGSYNVVWNFKLTPQGPPVQTFNFAFDVPGAVPAMSQSALLALMLVCAAIGATMLRR